MGWLRRQRKPFVTLAFALCVIPHCQVNKQGRPVVYGLLVEQKFQIWTGNRRKIWKCGRNDRQASELKAPPPPVFERWFLIWFFFKRGIILNWVSPPPKEFPSLFHLNISKDAFQNNISSQDFVHELIVLLAERQNARAHHKQRLRLMDILLYYILETSEITRFILSCFGVFLMLVDGQIKRVSFFCWKEKPEGPLLPAPAYHTVMYLR